MLIRSAEIFHVGDASGAGANLRASWRVVRGKRSEIDIEDGCDDGIAIKLQKDFAAVSVLRKQPGLADVRKIIVFFVRVIFQDGLGLSECDAGKKRNTDPVMDDATGNVDIVAVVEGVQLFQVELAAMQLRENLLPARIGEAVKVKKMAGEKIGVHVRFGFLAVMAESGQSFRLGLVGAGERSEKANGGCEQRHAKRAGSGRLHERNVLSLLFSQGL